MRLLTDEVALESGPFPPHPFFKKYAARRRLLWLAAGHTDMRKGFDSLGPVDVHLGFGIPTGSQIRFKV